jgi:hypothetical protein
MERNKLTGAIPSALSLLTNTSLFILSYGTGNRGLCILNDASNDGRLATSNDWPFPACGCKWLPACPSGTDVFNTQAVAGNTVNAVSPYYPDDATCCAGTGNSIRERMVADLFLDCSTRPCTATAKGLTQDYIHYAWNMPVTSTGTIPPQIAALTSVTWLFMINNGEISGTLPTQLGLMTLVELAELNGNAKLSGTIPPQIAGMTSVTIL